MTISASKPVRRRQVYALLVILTVLLGGYFWLRMNADPISLANWERIRNGMPLVEVLAILGEPTEKGPVYPNGDPPYQYARWVTKDGKTRIDLGLDKDGTVLWKNYRSDTLVNNALRALGFKPAPDGQATVKGTPK